MIVRELLDVVLTTGTILASGVLLHAAWFSKIGKNKKRACGSSCGFGPKTFPAKNPFGPLRKTISMRD